MADTQDNNEVGTMLHVTVRNGLTLAYFVGLVNATLDLLLSFGVHLNNTQHAAIMGFVNVAVLLAARVLHMPERTATGSVRMAHVAVLQHDPPQEGDTQPPPDAPPVTTVP